MITFLRMRPAEAITDSWAEVRRSEGTTALELDSPSPVDVSAALGAGLLVVGTSAPDSVEVAAWAVGPALAIELSDRGVPGWRVSVIDDGNEEAVLDALARSRAVFLRTGRSMVAGAADLASTPGLSAVVSVLVDTVADAIAAVEAGAGDLILRDWDTESIGDLRDALGGRLVERTALPPGLEVDEARSSLPPAVYTAWLGLVDGSGAARPRHSWAPGRDEPAPVPRSRLSAAWTDAAWLRGSSPDGLEHLDPGLRGILERSLEGTAPDRDEVERLFRSRGDEVDAVASVADTLRRRVNGDTVTYVVNRNINYTNQCYFRCGFCAFSKGPRSLNLRGDPYLLEVHEVVHRTREAWERGATEVCLQGGIHPEFTGDFYVSVLEAIKEAVPAMHVHGFTPLEVWQGAETLGLTVAGFLGRLKEAGLGTLPGTAAEILDDDVRRHLCPDKITTSEWARVMVTAHEMGLRSTSTMMFGHIDGPRSWANHLEVLRAIQRRTGGFTEFVPLPFVHMGAPIFLRGRARPGPTWDEVVLVHAVARIALAGLIDNIQASWVKLGLDGGAALLDAGCNDMGGTLMDENISRAAGASHGQLATPEELESTIRAAGRRPARRNTVYEIIEDAGPRPQDLSIGSPGPTAEI
jgi:FO synthase